MAWYKGRTLLIDIQDAFKILFSYNATAPMLWQTVSNVVRKTRTWL